MNYITMICPCPALTLRELHQNNSIYSFILPKSHIVQHSPFVPRIQSFKVMSLVTLKIILSNFYRITKIYFLHCSCYKISLKKSNFDLVLSYALPVAGTAKPSTKEYLQVENETWKRHCLASFSELFVFLVAFAL